MRDRVTLGSVTQVPPGLSIDDLRVLLPPRRTDLRGLQRRTATVGRYLNGANLVEDGGIETIPRWPGCDCLRCRAAGSTEHRDKTKPGH